MVVRTCALSHTRFVQRAKGGDAKEVQNEEEKAFLDYLKTLDSLDNPVPPGAAADVRSAILRETNAALYNDKWNVCAGYSFNILCLYLSLTVLVHVKRQRISCREGKFRLFIFLAR